jgi:hypothetical protein
MVKQCFECGTTEDLNEHHVVPRSRGGTKTIALCYSCHCRSHGRDSKGLIHSRLVSEGIKRAFERDPTLRQRWGRRQDPQAVKDLTRGRIAKADKHALKYGEIAYTAYHSGRSYRQVARLLMTAEIPTSRGHSQWSYSSTRQLIERYQKLTEET